MNRFNKFRLYYNTVRPLKLIQIFGRLFFSKIRAVNTNNIKYENCYFNGKIRFLSNENSKISGCIIEVLSHDINYQQGWHPNLDTLIIYNLHYFNYVNSLSSNQYESQASIINWIENNQDQYRESWKPYVVSVRVINWVKWVLKYNCYEKTILDSIYIQCRYLKKNNEFHLQGNHFYENAKALLMASFLFDSSESKEWKFWAESVIKSQSQEQILSDGGHFERSPMYHSIMLENIYDLINVIQAFEPNSLLLECLQSYPQKMLKWLEIISHSNGIIPKFNDTSVCFAPSQESLKRYHNKLGLRYENVTADSNHLIDSGFISHKSQNYKFICDVGQIGPKYLKGHGHSENMSFEVSVDTKRVFVNTGIGTYQAGLQRDYERSTLAHNTISINKKSSNEVWSSFRVARTSQCSSGSIVHHERTVKYSSTQDGFKKLYGSFLHTREFSFHDSELIIRDIFSDGDNKKHDVASFILHVNSGWNVIEVDGIIRISDSRTLIVIEPPLKAKITLEQTILYDSWYMPVNGYKIIFDVDLTYSKELTTKMNFSNEIY